MNNTLLKEEAPDQLKAESGSSAPTCSALWIEGDKPDTPKGSSTELWVTRRHRESGKLSVGRETYLNAHVMPCSDGCEPPDCAVPHKPEEDGYCEEYEWTNWSKGYCDHCETEWVRNSHYVDIVAHAFMSAPAPFSEHNTTITDHSQSTPPKS